MEEITHYKNISLIDIDGEIWKEVDGYEGLYMVSNMGRIKSMSRNVFHSKHGTKYYPSIIRKQYLNDGYCYLQLSKSDTKKAVKVHRIVAENWIPNPENKPTVNHIKGIKSDNRVSELEWATSEEQTYHAVLNKLTAQGHRHHMFGKNGSKSHLAKKVFQYSLDGCFLKEWDCVIQAATELKISRKNISSCALLKIRSIGGFQWRYFKKEDIGKHLEK